MKKRKISFYKANSLLVGAFLYLFLANSFQAFAHEINDYVSISPIPEWVVKQEIPNKKIYPSENRDTAFLLVNQQNKYSEKSQEIFVNYAEKMLTSSGVEDNSSLSIDFDPTYEKVDIHYVRIKRNGKLVSKLDLDNFILYHSEKDRDRLWFNGHLELTAIIPDIRVGDILDYAYTIRGKKPVLKHHFSVTMQHQWGLAVQKSYQRTLVSKNIQQSYKLLNHETEPQIGSTENYNIYIWEKENLDPILAEDETPYWYRQYPSSQITSFKSWAEVGQLFSPYYEITETPEAVGKISTEIKSETKSKKEQARRALNYVQKEIRYMGIEIGQSGFIPRSPEKVLHRRYGDCKDTTLLLLNILKDLDIEAKPLLVDTSYKKYISNYLPSNIFNHVIVYAQIDGQDYFLDPSRGEQIGDLDTLYQPRYGKGLIIAPESQGLISVEPEIKKYLIDVEDTYDIVSESRDVFFHSISSYYENEADRMYDLYVSEGIKYMEKNFLEFYQKTFPSIEQIKPMKVERDKEQGKVTFFVSYKIPDAWKTYEKSGLKKFWAYPEDIYNEIPKFVAGKRTTPYRINHPQTIRNTIKIKADKSWNFQDSEKKITSDAFDFSKSSVFRNEILTKTYSYITKKDHISADKFIETMKKIDNVKDSLAISLRKKIKDNKDWQKIFSAWDKDYVNINMFWIMIVLTMSLIFYNNSKSRK